MRIGEWICQIVGKGQSDKIVVKLFICEIVDREEWFLLKLYYKLKFGREGFRILKLVDQSVGGLSYEVIIWVMTFIVFIGKNE